MSICLLLSDYDNWYNQSGEVEMKREITEELLALVANGESETVEFKETTGQRVEACQRCAPF